MLGAASGCIAGLVAITPAAGFVTVVPAVLIGLIGGVLCFVAVAIVKAKLGTTTHSTHSAYTALAAPGAHCNRAVGNKNGKLRRCGRAFLRQRAPAVCTGGNGSGCYCDGRCWHLHNFKNSGAVTTLRADAAEEESGLDIVEHGERAYRQSIINGTPLTNLAVQEAPAFAAKPAPAGK